MNAQDERIADAMLSTDEFIPRTKMREEAKRFKKNEEARKRRVLVKLFDDNPDQGFKLKDILKLIDFGRPWILSRLNILSTELDSPIEIISGGGFKPYVYKKRAKKAVPISRALIMGKWGA